MGMSWVARAARTAVTAPVVASATTPVASASASPALSAHAASRRRRSSKARLQLVYSSSKDPHAVRGRLSCEWAVSLNLRAPRAHEERAIFVKLQTKIVKLHASH